MKNRKRGFSLVELLIVLAVIAALIATITPVALNAIKKAKATQVAQNLKTLASALENAAYVNGINSSGNDIGLISGVSTIGNLGRDIDENKYGIVYAQTNGAFTAVVFYLGGDADVYTVDDVLSEATSTAPDVPSGTYTKTLGADFIETNGIYYRITFNVY